MLTSFARSTAGPSNEREPGWFPLMLSFGYKDGLGFEEKFLLAALGRRVERTKSRPGEPRPPLRRWDDYFMKPLHVAFVWHMHQPYYKDDLTNTYLLPWVRLRSAKDYFKMPALLDAYPKVRATFNLVPSLLAQIEDYGKEDSVDLFLNISKRDAAELSSEERAFVIRWMRESPRALRVQQSPRYLELASRTADAQFTTQDMRDLQIWFNLAWCDA